MTWLLACSVCWGAAQDPVVHGTKLSMVFLLALTYLLLGGGVGMVVMARRRARRQQLRAHSIGLPDLVGLPDAGGPPPPAAREDLP